MQQHLSITAAGRTHELDALLEVDAGELRLGVQAMGQSAMTLRWDGKQLDQQRASWLPAALSGERVLFDLQLVYWPVSVLRAKLPSDWSIDESDGLRRLLRDGREIVSIQFPSEDHAILVQNSDGYRLDIQSSPVAPANP